MKKVILAFGSINSNIVLSVDPKLLVQNETTVGRIVMKSGSDSHGSQRRNPTDVSSGAIFDRYLCI